MKKRRMNRILGPDGRVLIVAMDHTSFLDSPVDALAAYGRTCEIVSAAGADAFLSPIGSIINFGDAFGAAAVIASIDTAPPFTEVAVERALAVGADGVKCMVYPFTGDATLTQAQRIAADAAKLGVPFLAEPIPGGWARNDLRSPETIAAGARIAAETGADFVKTFYTGDPDSMRTVVEYASVPVVILGGTRRDDLRSLLNEVYDAVIVAGCAGVAIGNNIWRADDPGSVTRALAAIIHGGASVDEAMAMAGEPVPA
jgi:DhnA family fructose-bisphosphate aldolase class Ia